MYITNPLSVGDTPDPFMMWFNGYYYLTCTERDKIVIHRSRNAEKIFFDECRTVYKAGNEVYHCIWAPEMHHIGNRWYIYSSGSTVGKEFKSIRMFCLESENDDPFGAYKFMDFTDRDIYAIDQTVFYCRETQKHYNVFVQIIPGSGNTIVIGELEKPWCIGQNRTILKKAEYDWELQKGRVTEGPFFIEHNGRRFMIYSANDTFSPYYCLGVMEFLGGDPLDLKNWKKYNHPFFEGENGVYAVGHASVFMSPDGQEYWLCYHGNRSTEQYDRSCYIQKFTFDNDGLPYFGKPIACGINFAAPSGENTKEVS